MSKGVDAEQDWAQILAPVLNHCVIGINYSSILCLSLLIAKTKIIKVTTHRAIVRIELMCKHFSG